MKTRKRRPSPRLILLTVVVLWATVVWPLTAQDSEITPAREQELFAQADEMLDGLSEIMGLDVLKPIPKAVITRDEIRQLIETRMEEETDEEEIRLEELFLKMFGFVDDDFDLAAEMVDVLTEQATALYDFKKKKLYLATWASKDMQEFALVHELVHALQDQHFNLRKYIDKGKGADGDLARTAVVEGQASWVMTEYVLRQSGLSMAKNRLMAIAAVSASRFEAEKYPVFSSSPLFLREALLFPYTQGLLFQQAMVEKLGPSGFAEIFRRAPLSSQQIFDAEAYLERQKPTKPRLPKAKIGRGFRRVATGDIGQLDHFILLKQYLGEKQAEELAPKWRGAHYSLREHKSESRPVLFYAVEWQSDADAGRYFDAYKQICEQKDKSVRFLSEEENRVLGRSESGGFILTRQGAVVTSVEGLPDDKLKRLRASGAE